MLDGRNFAWEPVNFWRTKWRFIDKSGFPLMSFEQSPEEFKLTELFKLHATATLESSRVTNQEFSMLINLGFYLIVLKQSGTAAACKGSARCHCRRRMVRIDNCQIYQEICTECRCCID